MSEEGPPVLIRPKIGQLPSGVVVAARRSRVTDRIYVLVSEAYYQRWHYDRPGLLMSMTFDAVNQLLAAPEDYGPVEIPAPREALAS